MKTLTGKIIAISILLTTMLPLKLFAQMDTRVPGIYTIVGGESIPLAYSNSSTVVRTSGNGIFQTGHEIYRFKGVTSAVFASDSLVMVIDPKKSVIVKTMKKYDVFVKSMTPDNIMVIPLTVNDEDQRREYDPGKNFSGLRVESTPEMEFEWERISDNSFSIKLSKLKPGEYAVAFRAARLASFDFSGIFCFTIAEGD